MYPFQNASHRPDVSRPRPIVRERQPAIAFLIIAVFGGGTAICAALMAPVLWAAVTDALQQSRPAYRNCGAVTENASRMSCDESGLKTKERHR